MLQLKNIMARYRASAAILIMLIALNGCQSMGGSTSGDDSIWSYVPADTIYFVGGKEAMPMQDYLKMSADTMSVYDKAMLDVMNEKEKSEPADAWKMLKQLVFSYYDLIKHPQDFSKITGIDDNMQFALYSVGTIPVLRIHLKDKAGFEAYLQQLETKAKITPQMQSRGNLKLHQYTVDAPAVKKPTNLSMVIGIQGDYAIFTGNFDPNNDKFSGLNPQILGEVKPKLALSPSRLDAMIGKYHFDPRFLMYIDHKEIVRGFTQRDNTFGAMLDTFNKLAEENTDMVGDAEAQNGEGENAQAQGDKAPAESKAIDESMNDIQSPACQKELMAKVDTWPQTVGGYTLLDFKNTPTILKFKSVVEINDPKFVQSLATLRGVIPDYITNLDVPMLAGIGLGINVDAVAPFVTQYIKDFTTPDYQCKFLADMKADMQKNNPAMQLAMVSGMAAGLSGISASVLKFDADFSKAKGDMPDIKDIQAIITISAKNPQMLLLMLSKMKPDLPPLQIPSDGSPIDLPLPLPIPGKVKLAQKGQHLVAYLGKDAEKLAEGMKNVPLNGENGIYSVKFDFSPIYKLLLSIPKPKTEEDGSEMKLQEALDLLKTLKYRVVETLNFTSNGIELDLGAHLNP